MALKGDLRAFDIAQVMRILADSRCSGQFRLNRMSQSIELFISDGVLMDADLLRDKPRLDLLTYLMHHGVVSAERMVELRLASGRADLTASDILMMEGTINHHDLAQFNSFRIIETALEALRWDRGIFTFTSREHDERRTGTAAVNMDTVLFEARCCTDETNKLLSMLPAGSIKLRRREGSGASPSEPSVTALWDLLKKERYLEELINLSPVGRILTILILQSLCEAGKIEALQVANYASNAIQEQPRAMSMEELTGHCQLLVRRISRAMIGLSLDDVSPGELKETLVLLQEILSQLLIRQPTFTLSHYEGRLLANNLPMPHPHDQFSSFIEILHRRNIRSIIFRQGLNDRDLIALLQVLTGRFAPDSDSASPEEFFTRQEITLVSLVELSNDHPHFNDAALNSHGQALPASTNKGEMPHPTRRDQPPLVTMVSSFTTLSFPTSIEERELQQSLHRLAVARTAALMVAAPDGEKARPAAEIITMLLGRLSAVMKREVLIAPTFADETLEQARLNVLASMEVNERYELLLAEYESVRQLRNSHQAGEKRRFLDHMRTACGHYLSALEKIATREELEPFKRRLRTRLFEAGSSLVDIDFFLGRHTQNGAEILALIERLNALPPEELLAETTVEETVVCLEKCLDVHRDSLPHMLVVPFMQLLERDDPTHRAAAAGIMVDFALTGVTHGRPDLVQEIQRKLAARLGMETTPSVFIVLVDHLQTLFQRLSQVDAIELITPPLSATLSRLLEQDAELPGPCIETVIEALGTVGDSLSIQTLLHTLEDDLLHETAAKALARIGKPVIQPLIDLLKMNPKAAIRFRITKILVELGAVITPFLLKELDNEIWYVRRNACMLLAKAGGSELLPRLAPLIKDVTPQVRREAITAIGRWSGESSEELLLQVLEDMDPRLRLQAVHYLGEVGSEKSVRELSRLVERDHPTMPVPDDELRKAACLALAKLGSPLAVPALSKLVSEGFLFTWGKRRDLFMQAIEALGTIGGREAKITLQAVAKSRNTTIRETAKKTLEALYRSENEFK
ncbi:HEAT repeat domain-containing protein [bacterium]|nr:HEAT repeat domain-containing protein [candidate division CSSED10-310 bacterium]